jgi:hypothetical protein
MAKATISKKSENSTRLNGYVLKAMDRVFLPKGTQAINVKFGDEEIRIEAEKTNVRQPEQPTEVKIN